MRKGYEIPGFLARFADGLGQEIQRSINYPFATYCKQRLSLYVDI